MRVRFTDQAKADLMEIGNYYHEIGAAKLAHRMIGQIKREVLAIGDYPESIPLYELLPGVRRLVVAGGAYLVFYRVMRHMQILHIRRGERAPAVAQDISH